MTPSLSNSPDLDFNIGPKLSEDSSSLGPVVAGLGSIGRVEEVNGLGAEELSSFKPTRHELKVLGKYWLRKVLDIRLDWYFFQQTDSNDINMKCFARRRLGRIEDLIGEEAFDEVVKEVHGEFEKQFGTVAWNRFLRGEEPHLDEKGMPIFPDK